MGKANRRFYKQAAAMLLSAAVAISGVPAMPARAAEGTETIQKQENDLRLWYTSPAENTYSGWERWALPLGNSSIGASVFGRVDSERIQLNEKSLWSGGPAEGRNYQGGNLEEKGRDGQTMKEIQEYFRNGDAAAGSSLCNQLTGLWDDSGTNGYGYYLSYGNLYLDFDGMSGVQVQNYERDLDMNTAIAGVSYDYNDVHYTRENFVSHPDNVLVTHIEADKAEKLNFKVRVIPDEGGNASGARTFTKEAENGTITIAGQLSDNQLKFHSATKVVNKDGKLTDNGDGSVQVSGATEVTIYTSIATDYKDEYPDYRTGESAEQLKQKVENYVNRAVGKGYAKTREDHLADYQEIFSRVDLDLGQSVSASPTNELITRYNNGTASASEKRQLEVMLFQYGRYLTIASSREAREGEDVTLPSNLQGMWVGKNNSSWHSDYHMNVNLQMNYWPVYVTNMAECADPLIDYVDALRAPGRVTAEIYAGIASTEENPENGFMAHTQNNPYGWTCPGWSFDWGWSPAAVPWILQNCWEHYEYTGDLKYMKENIYPMLKEEATLYNQMLIEDADGKYVSSPAYSPEHGPKTDGNTYEQTLIWQLFKDAITAGQLCGEDPEVLAQWQEKLDNLKGPVEIGESGQIKEWYEETTFNKDANGNSMGEGYGHRHMSHLLGLYPGDLISVDTPELLDAAEYSLTNRTDQTTAWGRGQRINSWARIGKGDRAYRVITDLFSVDVLQNLWSNHAPYQIDGNFGYTSGVAEMLLQSNMGYINILPALPSVWKDGAFEGLKARGNFTVDVCWKDQSPTEITLYSGNGNDASVRCEGISTAAVLDEEGIPVNYTVDAKDQITFATEAGKSYRITGLLSRQTISAPTGTKAVRSGADEVTFTWEAVTGEAPSYNIYRTTEGGSRKLIAENITDTVYVDETARKELGSLTYQVSAEAGPETDRRVSGLSVPAVTEEKEVESLDGIVDDRDARITYTGGWETYGGEEGMIQNTTTFLASPSGGETASMTFHGVGIRVYATVHYDRGMADIYIDGEKVGTADSYRSSKKNGEIIFEYRDPELAGKSHTLKTVVTNTKNPSSYRTKFEFDAFQVLSEADLVEEVQVVSKSGMITLAKAGSSLQLEAKTKPEGTGNKVNWKVTDTDGNATGLAKIDQNGLLTVGDESGTVRVTAVSTADASKTGWLDITIAIPGQTAMESEFTEFTNGTALNSAFTWEGGWYRWGPEDGNYNSDKAETVNNGSAVSGSFEGTGIQIFGQKNWTFGALTLTIDDGEAITVDEKLPSGQDQKQALIYENMELSEGSHTFRMVSSGKVSLDYLMVWRPQADAGMAADKTGLQEQIEEAFGNYEECYTPESWETFSGAYDHAVAVMNQSDAEKQQVDEAAEALKEAAKVLEERPESELPRPDLTGKTVRMLDCEANSVVLIWDGANDAVSYEIYRDGQTDAVGTTEGTFFRDNHLESGTVYRYTVRAYNRIGVYSDYETLEIQTMEEPDTQAPEQVTGLKKTGNHILWNPSADNKGVAGYEIRVNGITAGTTDADTFSWELGSLNEGEVYTVSVIAFDAAGNQSIPASLSFVAEDEEETDLDEMLRKVQEAKAAAEKAKALAEAARDEAQKSKDQAEADQAAALEAVKEAEKAKEAAEEAIRNLGADSAAAKEAMEQAVRKAEEAELAKQEADQKKAEALAMEQSAKAAQAEAEAAAEEAKALAALAEAKAAEADAAKKQAEAEREAAEEARKQAEAEHEAAKEALRQAEKARSKAEAARLEAEKARGELEQLIAGQQDKPGKAVLRSVKSTGKGKVKVSWKKVKGASGYEIQYAQNSKFKNAVTRKAGGGKTSTTLKKLTSKKKYYVRVRAYKNTASGKVYGAYSKGKKVVVK
ncbi:MAG: glycosyl hydrolase family 95 catalytic domain-containing protein [Hominisplanchenecus sp.]